MTKLTAAQLDRAAGVLLATAAGDALGAGYEFGPPLPETAEVGMIGGGYCGWTPGEWTDDTSMAIAIAEVAATGVDLRSDEAQDCIVARWYDWSRTANDVGKQTSAVLGAVGRDSDRISAAAARHASHALHERTGVAGRPPGARGHGRPLHCPICGARPVCNRRDQGSQRRSWRGLVPATATSRNARLRLGTHGVVLAGVARLSALLERPGALQPNKYRSFGRLEGSLSGRWRRS